jgi:hypothetical protein
LLTQRAVAGVADVELRDAAGPELMEDLGEQLLLLGKWLYTVRLETPAVAAILSMLVTSNPLARNSAMAAATMASRLRSVRRWGAVMAGDGLREKLHSAVYLLRVLLQS